MDVDGHLPKSRDEAIHATCGEPSVVTRLAMEQLAPLLIEYLPCGACREDRPAVEFILPSGRVPR